MNELIHLEKNQNISDNQKISSMLQDILRGRVTEIDYLNGLVADKAKELGISTPVNNEVIELVKTMETRQITPDPENVHLIKSIA